MTAAGPITGVAHMLSHPFIQHALVAGTAIALLSGLVGYFVVLRGQVRRRHRHDVRLGSGAGCVLPGHLHDAHQHR